MTERIGPVVISIGTTDAQWEEDTAIIRTMQPDMIKVPIEDAFSPYPHRIRQLVDELAPRLVVLSCGMQSILGGWGAVQHLVGQQMETIKAHPEIPFVIELGNEPEYHDPPWGGAKDAQYFYRYQILTLAKLLKEWGPPNLKVGASMPVRLDHARDVVFAGDEWGRVVDAVDYLCTHYYGYEYIGDGAGNGKDHNAAWGPIYEMLKGTACKILFTEIGIDSPSSTLETKSLRLLKWLEEQPEQVAGAAIWCVGPWRNMGLDIPGASVYGNRRRQQVPTPPPTKEQSMAQEWYPKAERGSSPWQNDGPAYGRQWPGNVTMVVDHHTAATWQGTVNTFGPESGRKVSAHFLVGRDGRVHQFVSLRDIAWHAGNWGVNVHSVGIEHEHYQRGGAWSDWTDAQINASAELHAWLEQQMGGFSIHKHKEFENTACPESLPLAEIELRMKRAQYQSVKPVGDHRDTGTGIPLSYGFKTLYEEAERAPNQLGIRLLGAGPICEPFDMAFGDNPGQLYTVQLLERGGGFMYEGGQEEPWRNHAMTTWQVIEAWRFGIKHNKIPEQFIPAHLR